MNKCMRCGIESELEKIYMIKSLDGKIFYLCCDCAVDYIQQEKQLTEHSIK